METTSKSRLIVSINYEKLYNSACFLTAPRIWQTLLLNYLQNKFSSSTIRILYVFCFTKFFSESCMNFFNRILFSSISHQKRIVSNISPSSAAELDVIANSEAGNRRQTHAGLRSIPGQFVRPIRY